MQHNKKWPREEVSGFSQNFPSTFFYISFREHSFPSLKICTLRLAKIPTQRTYQCLLNEF